VRAQGPCSKPRDTRVRSWAGCGASAAAAAALETRSRIPTPRHPAKGPPRRPSTVKKGGERRGGWWRFRQPSRQTAARSFQRRLSAGSGGPRGPPTSSTCRNVAIRSRGSARAGPELQGLGGPRSRGTPRRRSIARMRRPAPETPCAVAARWQGSHFPGGRPRDRAGPSRAASTRRPHVFRGGTVGLEPVPTRCS
jgi:hypothetical protein